MINSWDDWFKGHVNAYFRFMGYQHLQSQLQSKVRRYKEQASSIDFIAEGLKGLDNWDVYSFAKTWKTPHEAWDGLDPEIKGLFVSLVAMGVSMAVLTVCTGATMGWGAPACSILAGAVSGAVRAGMEAQIAGEGTVVTHTRMIKGAIAGGASAAIAGDIIGDGTTTQSVGDADTLKKSVMKAEWFKAITDGAIRGSLDEGIYTAVVYDGSPTDIFQSAVGGGISGGISGYGKWTWSEYSGDSWKAVAGVDYAGFSGNGATYAILTALWAARDNKI